MQGKQTININLKQVDTPSSEFDPFSLSYAIEGKIATEIESATTVGKFIRELTIPE